MRIGDCIHGLCNSRFPLLQTFQAYLRHAVLSTVDPPLKWRATVRGPSGTGYLDRTKDILAGVGCRAGRYQSDCRESLIEVVHDVVYIFDSDGDADQAVGDSYFPPSLCAQRGVSHGCGMRD